MRHFLLLLILLLPLSAQDNWPAFRGADSRGVSENPDLPDTWSATQNVAWKTDLPGRAWSSPIVWGNKVFLTTVINEGETESPKKGLSPSNSPPTNPPYNQRAKKPCKPTSTRSS